jgi:hypothetical protein
MPSSTSRITLPLWSRAEYPFERIVAFARGVGLCIDQAQDLDLYKFFQKFSIAILVYNFFKDQAPVRYASVQTICVLLRRSNFRMYSQHRQPV